MARRSLDHTWLFRDRMIREKHGMCREFSMLGEERVDTPQGRSL